jgi:Tfp pilus assembly protein PilF
MTRHPAIARILVALSALAAACSGAVSSKDAGKAEYHYKLANNYYADHNLAATRRELHDALKLDPDHASAHYLQGIVDLGMDDAAGAVAEFQAALRLKPDFLEARNNLGTALMAQGRFEEAVQAIQPLLEDPLYATPALAQGNVGWAYYQLGNLADARRHLEMAVFLNPKFCLGFNNLGLVHKDTGNARAAREAFEKAVKLCPKFAEPWYHLGVLLQEAADLAGAEEAFAKCAELASDSALGKRCTARR